MSEGGSWLSYINLSDKYEIKARFFPGILTILVALPGLTAFSAAYLDGFNVILSGVGIGAILAVFISHLASAFGNRIQKRFWPRWPHDSPTNQYLHPDNKLRSAQQKSIWYGAIKRLAGIDIELAVQQNDEEALEASINDATSRLRYLLREISYADRLEIHNADYGFARNLTGLRPLWLTLAAGSSLACWVAYFRLDGRIDLCLYSTVILLVALPLAFNILPAYVRDRANHYAESLFGAMMELDAEESIGRLSKAEITKA